MTLHKDALRLAGVYTIILFVVCTVFSITLYRISSAEFERSMRKPPRTFFYDMDEYLNQQAELVSDFKSRLIVRILFIDAGILVSGAALSYVFARKTLEPIEAAREKMERFTTDAAHDLRTPLAAMKVENEILLGEDTISTKAAKQQFASTIEEVDKLADMVENLLLSLKSGAISHDDSFLVSDVLTRAVKTVSPIAEAKNIALQSDIVTAKANKTGSAMMLERAFVSLLDNAIKYTPDGGEVSVSAKQCKKSYVVMIRDTGKGIASKDLPHIFDKLYRADTSRQNTGQDGHGLGLFIVKNTIESMQGTVHVESVVDKGTVVTVSL
jgi:two-component system, OmpR family, sensor histidine kinase CiaH